MSYNYNNERKNERRFITSLIVFCALLAIVPTVVFYAYKELRDTEVSNCEHYKDSITAEYKLLEDEYFKLQYEHSTLMDVLNDSANKHLSIFQLNNQ